MNILLLHGAIGSASQLEPLKKVLDKEHSVYSINFMGHGGEAVNGSFSIEAFANQVLAWIEENKKDNLCILGYSMGGYVALYLALNHPGKISKVITLGTKFHWDEATAQREIKMLDPETIEMKVPAFAAILKERHHPTDWKTVLNNTTEMMLEMGRDNPFKLREAAMIQTPCLLLLGDSDTMVSMVETSTMFHQLPNAQLGILPGTAHAIEKVNLDLLLAMVNPFLLIKA